MTSMIFEVNFNDFRRRDFGNEFNSKLYEPYFKSDDALFEEYINSKKWQSFKLNLNKSIMCQQNYNRLLLESRPVIARNQTSRARSRKALQSIETLRGKVSQCNSLITKYIKEKEAGSPMILHVKNRLAIMMMASKSKARKRFQLETCLRL